MIDCQTDGGCHDLEINWTSDQPHLICGEHMWVCDGNDNVCSECRDTFNGDDIYLPTTDPTIQPTAFESTTFEFTTMEPTPAPSSVVMESAQMCLEEREDLLLQLKAHYVILAVLLLVLFVFICR